MNPSVSSLLDKVLYDKNSAFYDIEFTDIDGNEQPFSTFVERFFSKTLRDRVESIEITDQINGPNSAVIVFSGLSRNEADSPFFDEMNLTYVKVKVGYYYTAAPVPASRQLFEGLLYNIEWDYRETGIVAICHFVEKLYDVFDQPFSEFASLVSDKETKNQSVTVVEFLTRVAKKENFNFVSYVVDNENQPVKSFYEAPYKPSMSAKATLMDYIKDVVKRYHTGYLVKENFLYIGHPDTPIDASKVFVYGVNQDFSVGGVSLPIPLGPPTSGLNKENEELSPNEKKRLAAFVEDHFEKIQIQYRDPKDVYRNNFVAIVGEDNGFPVLKKISQLAKDATFSQKAIKKGLKKEAKKRLKGESKSSFFVETPGVSVGKKGVTRAQLKKAHAEKGKKIEAAQESVDSYVLHNPTQVSGTVKDAQEKALLDIRKKMLQQLVCIVTGCPGDNAFGTPFAFTVLGLAKIHQGKYSAVKVVHRIDTSQGYSMDIHGVKFRHFAVDAVIDKALPPKPTAPPGPKPKERYVYRIKRFNGHVISHHKVESKAVSDAKHRLLKAELNLDDAFQFEEIYKEDLATVRGEGHQTPQFETVPAGTPRTPF
jgi:hypothetical protein